ncbi:MAG: TldD/PmbA family protein, partial [FCB group bacterium]|nr:TldD/PmbA family protein [FCB group bacterium]
MDKADLQNGLHRAAALGAADAEIVLVRDADFSVDVSRGEVETFSLAEAIGVGARVFTPDRRMGFSYAADLAGSIDAVVEAAWQNALGSDPDEHNVLPEEAGVSEADWAEQDFAVVPSADKVAFARELERKALAADPRITVIQHARYGDSTYEVTLVNSRGLSRTYRNASCSCSVVAMAAAPDVDSETGWEFDHARQFANLRPDFVVQGAAEDATRLLGGRPCATGAVPVVLDNYVAVQFLQIIGPALMANNVLKGKSLFAKDRGELIASERVTLIDQNDLPNGINRSPFDAEGAPARRVVPVEKGVLQAFLHNSYTADKMGESTTANATRGGFRSTPEVGATNFYLDPGTQTQDDLLQAAGQGLFVTGAMGVHTADPISGDFSFGATGLLIENGQLGRPVRGVTIAGNMKDVLRGIVAVGNDLRFFGAYGSPS